MEVVNNKEGKPLAYYLEKFRETDIAAVAARCGLPLDEAQGTMRMTLLGETYSVSHPDFTVVGPAPLTDAERILLLRYLVDGQYAMPAGQYLTYPGERSISSSSPGGASSASPSPTGRSRSCCAASWSASPPRGWPAATAAGRWS